MGIDMREKNKAYGREGQSGAGERREQEVVGVVRGQLTQASEAQDSGSSLAGDISKYFLLYLILYYCFKKSPLFPNGINFQSHKTWIAPMVEQGDE